VRTHPAAKGSSARRVSARAHAGVFTVGGAGSIEREELCQLNCALPAAALTPTQSTSRSAPAVACPSIPRPRCCCCCSRCLCSHCRCLCCLIYGPFIGSKVRAVGRSRRRCCCWSGLLLLLLLLLLYGCRRRAYYVSMTYGPAARDTSAKPKHELARAAGAVTTA
jgi:hypothetical protein